MSGTEFVVNFWHWLVLGLALMLVELALPSTYFLWMGLAALVVGIVFWLIPGLNFDGQIILFAVLTFSAIILGKRYLKRHPIVSDRPMLNVRGAQNIGRIATLHEPIINGVGKVHLDDTLWKVFGPDLPINARVRVVAVEGISLRVEPLHDGAETSTHHDQADGGDGGSGD
ncbi:MAG TPA: NfeD family protein [bacterium]|nr:NfeD family protein [bacterium]